MIGTVKQKVTSSLYIIYNFVSMYVCVYIFESTQKRKDRMKLLK